MESRVTVETDLLATLEDQGYRVTVPRRRLLSLLSSKQEGFSVEELCGEVPGVGRATVYRTVKLLLDSGAICKLTPARRPHPSTAWDARSTITTPCVYAAGAWESSGTPRWSGCCAQWATKCRARSWATAWSSTSPARSACPKREAAEEIRI